MLFERVSRVDVGRPFRGTAATFFALVVCAAAIHGVIAAPASLPALDAANEAWERGDYASALSAYIRLLDAPGGEKLVEPIAQATGELFETRELTADGRAGRFSPDGRYIVYETGLEVSRRTRILKNDSTRAEVADARRTSGIVT